MARRRRAEAEAASRSDAEVGNGELSSVSGGAVGSRAGGHLCRRPGRRHPLRSASLGITGLAMLTTCCAQIGEPGILGEYFAPVPESCGAAGEGSSVAFDGLLPNLTRRDRALNFADTLSFDLQACAFESGPSGKQAYACREATTLRRNFGVRWSGQLWVQTAGEYLFEMEYSDGARFIMGHDHFCPGPTCGVRSEVMNMRPGDLPLTSNKDNQLAFAKQCSDCAVDNYLICFVSSNGCEPFPLWMLEGDNGLNGTCSSGARKIQASRYLEEGEHPFKIEYFQRQGEARFTLRWQGPGSNALAPIPSAAFTFPMGAGLNAEVFSVQNLPQFLPPASSFGGLIPGAKLLQRYSDIMEDTSEGSAWSDSIELMGPVMVRWTGYLQLSAGGRYKFRIESDDGARLTIGGRGMGGEVVVVDNDGIKEGHVSKEGFADLLPGKSAVRIEYLFSPGADGPFGDTGLPKPPHCLVFYQGPDTKDMELLISRNWGESLHLTDLECGSRSWTRGGGLTLSRDCNGFCYDTAEALIGDFVCDDGISSPTNFYCKAFEFDSGDCVINAPPEEQTTPRPPNPCLESCPTGNWKRKDCSACDVEEDGMCVGNAVPGCVQGPNDPPGICNYGRCCVAKFTNLEYWGSDCLAFGALNNCTYALERLLTEVRSTPRSLASQAAGAPEVVKPVRAQLLVDCEGANCATITEDRVRNPFTGVETEAFVCPVQESSDEGLACFEGPWAETDPDPLEECQNDSFKYNFCTNRKTRVGKPYQTCCSFLWLAASGSPYCRFVGLEVGSCGQWLAAYKDSVSGLQFQRIESELVLKECGKDEGDLCNDPMDEEVGCPQFVIERPKQVEHLIPVQVDLEELLRQGGEAESEGVPWVLIVIPAGGLVLVCGTFYAVVKFLKDPEHSVWHTKKAKIVQGDTFVEPKQDLDTKRGAPGGYILDSVPYGAVQPRPYALKQLLRAKRNQQGPRALRIDPALAVGEVTTAAFDGKLAVEAVVKGMAVEDFRAVTEAEGVVAPVSPLPLRAVAKALGDIAPVEEPTTPSWHSSEGEEEREARRQGLAAAKEQPGAAATLAGARAALRDDGAPAPPALADAAASIEDEGQDVSGFGASFQLVEQVPGQIVESQAFTSAQPPPPPDSREDLLRTAGELARTQAAFLPPPKPGAVNVVEAVRLSTTAGAVVSAAPDSSAKRPAAAARMLRQGMTSGVPRVCT